MGSGWSKIDPIGSSDERGDTVIETERLRLRRWRDSDISSLARWNADPRFMRHMGRGPLTRDESAAALTRYQRHWAEHGFGLFAVEDRSTGVLIGRAGSQFHRLWPADPEVGWGLDPDWWGRGFATEAGDACVRWAFHHLEINRLVSITTPENVASRRVMQKLGFSLMQELSDPLLNTTVLLHARERGAQRPNP
jgi:RimJ/RimL family protein N-acetyltransferase